MRKLDGRRVFITGGAGGIGRALARRFAAEGCRVVLADRDEAALATAADDLAAAGVAVARLALDVTDFAALEEARDRLHAEQGPIEILVNNAGIVHGGGFLDVSLEHHLATFRVNVEGLVALTHALLPDLLVAGEGHLVNVASASGFIGLPFGSSYASSKRAVIGFSESIRLELEKQGHRHVGVTTVCPAYVETGMFAGVKPPLLTPFLTPDRLARRVVAAVRRNRSFVLEPFMVKLTPFLVNALPQPLADRLADFFGASTSMATWRGRG